MGPKGLGPTHGEGFITKGAARSAAVFTTTRRAARPGRPYYERASYLGGPQARSLLILGERGLPSEPSWTGILLSMGCDELIRLYFFSFLRCSCVSAVFSRRAETQIVHDLRRVQPQNVVVVFIFSRYRSKSITLIYLPPPCFGAKSGRFELNLGYF